MEKARRLAREGKRVLLLCFNKLLAESLAKRADGFTVKNFHGLCRDLANAAGIPFRLPKDPVAAKEYWEVEPPQQLMRALEAFPDERFDAVIVDEEPIWRRTERASGADACLADLELSEHSTDRHLRIGLRGRYAECERGDTGGRRGGDCLYDGARDARGCPDITP
jgi:hypothetical protein